MRVKCSTSPSLKLSPIEIVPWLWMPITSPGQAVSTISRSDAMNVSALASFSSLPVRVCSAFIRSEEHTSELQSLMRSSYAVFCLQKKTSTMTYEHNTHLHTSNTKNTT